MAVSSRSAKLIYWSLKSRSYDRALSDTLIDVGRSAAAEPWATRRVAALLLQRQFLLLAPGALAEHDRLLVRLGLKDRTGLQLPLREFVLSEGHTSRKLPVFIRELRRKLSRTNGCFEPGSLSGAVCSVERYAQSDCKLPLARYLFTPEEVVAAISSGTRISRGEELPARRDAEMVEEEDACRRRALPPYEHRVLALLCDPARIFWVAEHPVSELNSLVENPKGTVVLAVKPPGSSVEFEIKRCGSPGPQLLSAIYERDGARVADSHRLHAASMAWHLIFETRAAARFSRIYRLIHGASPSVAITHRMKSVCSIPTSQGDRSTVDFFNTPQAFGPGFAAMRTQLKKCVRSSLDAGELGSDDLPGELGSTLNFLMQAWPAQAIQSNTSSFRLDRLAEYLSPGGPRLYFQGASKIGRGDLKWLADQLLDEILPRRTQVAGAFGGFTRYLDEIFARPANRRQANRLFLQLLQQLGTFSGTLAGILGYSNGESMVPRNVGLRAVWSGGNWQVSLYFMDQDDLHLATPRELNLPVERVLRGMLLDQQFCSARREPSRSCLSALAKIYRVDEQVFAEGQLALRKARDAAVRKTRQELKRSIPLRNNFSPTFLTRLDEFARICQAFSRKRQELLAQPSQLEGFLRRHFPALPEDDTFLGQCAKAIQASEQHFFLNPDA